MTRSHLLFGAAVVLGVGTCIFVGCGSDSPSPSAAPDAGQDATTTSDATKPDDSGSVPDTASNADASDAGAADDASDASDAALQAPIFESLKPHDAGVEAGLTLWWTNVQPDCDGVEAWRKDALDPYALILTAPGTSTAADDPSATQNWNYTYRLRCKKGSAYSDYSYELSANPQQ